MWKQKNKLLVVMAFFLSGLSISAQIIADNGIEEIRKTPNPRLDANALELHMPHVDFREVFKRLDAKETIRKGGISADNFKSDGRVELRMYMYDKSKTDGKGNLLYYCYSNRNSQEGEYVEAGEMVTIPSTFEKADTSVNIQVASTDIVSLLQATRVKSTCKELVDKRLSNFSQTAMIASSALLFGGGGCLAGTALSAWAGPEAAIPGCLIGGLFGAVGGIALGGSTVPDITILTEEVHECLKEAIPWQPVLVEVKVKNARLNKIKLPILGEKSISELFNDNINNFEVTVYVNGNQTKTISYPQNVSNIPTINMKMGDKVEFLVEMEKNKLRKPEIHGIPDVWVAPFAGDVIFQCNPDVQPGSYRPFIGFDSRVHTLMLRPYPEGFKEKYDDWVQTTNITYPSIAGYRWGFTMNRQMSADIIKYVPVHIWPKAHLDKNNNPTSQRQNQKEGLNMQYLSYFNNWRDSEFKSYDGNVSYMMGFDDDEIAYFNHPYYNADSKHINGNLVKLEVLPWKTMIEGTRTQYNPINGFPTKGEPINLMVDAYKKFKGEYGPNYRPYQGYEIQDIGTSKYSPNGLGRNNENPGLVTIKIGCCQEIKMKFQVDSPLDNAPYRDKSYGFYEALEGPENPSYAEQKVAYWLHGISDKPDSEIAKYTVKYKYMNRLGVIKSSEVNALTIVNDKRNSVGILGSFWNWFKSNLRTYGFNIGNPSDFSTSRPAYSWIEAYYQRTPDSEPVLVAGKELNQIFLMFCGVTHFNGKPFVQGKGHGSKIFLEDIRNNKYGKFDTQRNYGSEENPKTKYVNKYTNTYVIPKNTTLAFTTFDGDPYRFDNDEEEWYLSNRSIAKRVKDDVLDGTAAGSTEAALQYYIGTSGSSSLTLITSRSGKDVSYDFTNTGTFDLKVAYRKGSDLYNKITVVDYPNNDKARIQERALTNNEKTWLGIQNSPNEYYAYEVVDVYSKFQWEDGLRNKNVPAEKPNRWAPYNDYLDAYVWTHKTNNTNPEISTTASSLMIALEANYADRIKAWFWDDWALHYSSNWLKSTNANGNQGIPNYVSESNLTRIKKPSDLNPFNNYFSTNLFNQNKYANQLKTPWQFVIPLISYTDYHGYRFRTNPSCIYDLAKVFSSTNGAFTGNPPNPADPNDIQAPDISDSDKDFQEFYHNVKNGRILIKSAQAAINGYEFTAYQRDESSKDNKGTRMASFSKTLSRQAPSKEIEKSNTSNELTTVTPNPTSGEIQITSGADTGDINTIEIYDLSGKLIRTYQTTSTEKSIVKLNISSLPDGVYIVKVIGQTGNINKKIIKKG